MSSIVEAKKAIIIGRKLDGTKEPKYFGMDAVDFATRHIQVLAITRKGKTYTASGIVEGCLDADIPVVIIDPVGHYWGLKEKYDILCLGSTKGKNRAHIDIPLEYSTKDFDRVAEELGEYIGRHQFSVILDMKGWKYYGMRKFVEKFLTSLKDNNEEQRQVLIEEADIFAPQNPFTDEERFCEAAVEDVARRGSASGLGSIIVTQRPASISKNILSQSDLSIVLNLGSAQDMTAFAGLIKDDDKFLTEEENELPEAKTKALLAQRLRKIRSRVKNLPIGQAFVYSPQWLDARFFISVNKKKTYHSGATLRSPDYKPQSEINIKPFAYKSEVNVDFGTPEVESSPKKHAEQISHGHVSNTLLKELDELRKERATLQNEVSRYTGEIENLQRTLAMERQEKEQYEDEHRTTEQFREALAKFMPTASAMQSMGAEALQLVTGRTQIVVKEEKREDASFSEGSLEWKLVNLMSKGFFDSGKSTTDVQRELFKKYGGTTKREDPEDNNAKKWQSEILKPAMLKLSRYPYEILTQDGEVWVTTEEAKKRVSMVK